MNEAVPTAQRLDRSGSPALAGFEAAGRVAPAALLASLPGLVFLAGFDHLAYGLGLLAGAVLAGILIAPRAARLGAASVPEALHMRFGAATSFVAAVVIVLVVLPLLAAELALIGYVAEARFGIPYLAAVLMSAAAAAAIALLVGNRRIGRMTAGAFALIAASLLVPLLLMAFASGAAVPHLAYGQALSAVGGLEERLVESGLVDFDTFSMHTTPFLRLSARDHVALVLSLALGTAALPPLLSALAAGNRPAAARLAGAWTAFFAMLVLMTVPALSAYAKLEIYGALTGETPLAQLPGWLEAPLRAGLARIHGTSPYLLSAVAEAVRAGQADVAAVAGHLRADAAASAQWLALDDGLREAILASARRLAEAPHASVWDVYLTSVLPAAAAAAGNEAATLTQASLAIEPLGLLLALPELAGMPAWGAALIMAGLLAAALVVAAALAASLRSLPRTGRRDEAALGGMWRARMPVLAAGAVAAGLAALRPGDLAAVVVSALSLAAAGLFPVLALGLAWRRATAAGAIAAILAGGGVTLYYEVGIQAFPAAFYRTWAPLSNAGELAAEEFAALETDVREAESPEARAAAATALETLARGTATRRGIANWLGIDSASGAVFGVPLGLLALVLVSVLTRRGAPQP